MNRTSHLIATAGALLLACLLSAPAAAAPPGADWVPVETARLDGLRGGFAAPSGLVIAFGIERVVRVNGEVVLSTSLRIPDIARMTAEQAGVLAGLRDSQVVQVGSGTVVSGGTGGLLIQNAVDGQQLSALTSLDVSLNTLQLYRDTQLGATISSAVIGAATSP